MSHEPRATSETVPDVSATTDRLDAPDSKLAAAATPILTSERLTEIWPALFGGLREVLGARRWALFREATPGGVEGSKLILFVTQEFHLEGLQRDAAVTALVATQATDLLGVPVSVEFRRATDDGRSLAAVEPLELDKDRLFEAPAEAIDPTALLERELGATLVEEIPND